MQPECATCCQYSHGAMQPECATCCQYRKEVDTLKNTVEARDAEIATLKARLEHKPGEGTCEEGEEGGRQSDSGSEEPEVLELPYWDETLKIWTCAAGCGGEVDETICISCEKEHVEPEPNEYSLSTESQSDTVDRIPRQRGDTPTFDVGNIRVPNSWPYDDSEYCELMQRGVSPLMCDTFDMRFSQDGGIYAFADQALFDEFSGDGMLQGDFWRISLGRRIEVDADDYNGSEFLEGLLEDALLFRARDEARKWETVLQVDAQGRRTWVTRPIQALCDAQEGNGSNVQSATAAVADDDSVKGASSCSDDDSELDSSRKLQSRVVDPATGKTLIKNKWYKKDAEEEPDESDMDVDVIKKEEAEDVSLDGEVDSGSDSDSQPGSDWDSDECLSGDDMTSLRELEMRFETVSRAIKERRAPSPGPPI